ncbi:uncharacterized protein SPPG_04428 [Spizellomyces punctatus DAOM BR117]|uniref:Uncharacterized protein n=1 Tax=Spizellomyces punctatus (strain DAOM BR117) TaxID=645134 RepID=A0A0L0HGF3_SPIPD|nr:uncharacterized protein SPPG_04428 [Spizellomyces punctatus DAOM BR117]KND00087.1 hypothetical protein SPPG_04428 [Spizellomyces punctatus DAOM BR117]|eukprot:XP_016608126.1 hypothetical protein SPPG_04428 [Spizellomyces punctatus DAOM BR117]
MPPKKKQKLEKLPTCLHTCNKTSFAKAFLPNETYRQRLLDYIAIIHQLADHASHALKFYILSAPSVPMVDQDTIEAILYLLNKGEAWQPRTDAKKGQKQQLPPKSDVQKAFFAHLHYLKSIFLFDTVPESLDDLTAEESELLEEMWSFIPLSDQPLTYSVAVDPLAFFPAYCWLSSLYEKHGFRRFSAIPLRHSLIQSHVRIDTIILYSHILCIMQREAEALEKDDLWMRVCNLHTKAFRSRCHMQFEGSITMDSTSVSVYLKHPNADKYRKHGARKSAKTLEAEVKAVYVENNLPAC